MATINRRLTARIEGDFVVFIIGARINRWWKIFANFWFLMAMPRMIAELEKRPESGFLGAKPVGLGVFVQYWRSFDQLLAYAKSRDSLHFPAWVRFNKRIGTGGDFGIWHETYVVRAGQYECIYVNMPVYGLGKVAERHDAAGTLETAAGRLGRS